MENQKFTVGFEQLVDGSVKDSKLVADPRTALNLVASLMACDSVVTIVLNRG